MTFHGHDNVCTMNELPFLSRIEKDSIRERERVCKRNGDPIKLKPLEVDDDDLSIGRNIVHYFGTCIRHIEKTGKQ